MTRLLAACLPHFRAVRHTSSVTQPPTCRPCEADFGSDVKPYHYTQAWYIRSLIPGFFNSSLDGAGFCLCQGDFNSHHIMIDLTKSQPRITAIIDWEISSTQPIASLARYPPFIVNHPLWGSNDPLHARNMQDQTTFCRLIWEAEIEACPRGGFVFSRLVANSGGIHLFEEALRCRDARCHARFMSYVLGERKRLSLPTTT
ncbi:hypothetical protein BKA93DRAFT_795417 [Sparassis latifolia]